MRRPAPFAAFILLLLSLTAPTGVFAFSLPADGTARVIEVIDGDTVKLDSGREVRLVGIQAPKLPLGRRGFAEWPLAQDAKARLEALTADKAVTLHYGGAREDRHGRLLAHVTAGVTADATAPVTAGVTADRPAADAPWAQGEMLRAGLARVYSFPDNRALVAEMLALEREARAARRGIWADSYYRIRKPEETRRDIETFQLVEGRVLQAAAVKDRIYLNFGPDYRSDFTIAIARRDLKLFGRAFDAQALAGKSVRVRGWLKSVNGPMIEATHPEQIEVLNP